jgi:hypothetical protein
MKKVLQILILMTFSFNASSQQPRDEEVFLECKGTFILCMEKANGRECDSPRNGINVISWNGSQIKHQDDYGFMDFDKGCNVSDRIISCSSKKDSTFLGGQSTGWIEIERATGRTSWTNELVHNEDNPARWKDGVTGYKSTYQAYCTPRAQKNLF